MKYTPNHTVSEQLSILCQGCEDILPPKLLEEKLIDAEEKGIPLNVKLGFDPTRPDLHLGHTVPLTKLAQFQRLGHQAILVIGDFTAQVGDPTGKNKARPPLSRNEIIENMLTYTTQAFKILDKEKTLIRYNNDWLGSLSPHDFIKLLASHTVQQMIQREDFAKRLDGNTPIYLHELLYPLLQGYDSVALKADVELGGTDQKFNLLVGRELQKTYGQSQQVIMTTPLLEGLDGHEKMSKSLDNYIGIDMPPNEMFGKLMSISDVLMHRYYKCTSLKAADHIKDVVSGKVHPMEAKLALASELVTRFHSAESALEAHAYFKSTVTQKLVPDEIPEVEVDYTESLDIAQLIADLKLAPSKSEARRLIKQGGVRVDGEQLNSEQIHPEKELSYVLKVGKRKFVKIKMI